ncbi:Endoglucanase 3 [Acorus calamus]|uniref:Endoglucanase n=1 Tax=Acorus calamus TaxID=4465 RepID=A0AAV9CKK4_ACOCL|nr:Endoglucanase 3 [Acorus calamus]
MASLQLQLSLLLCCIFVGAHVEGLQNYTDALAKSILYFQGQRSGRLPPDQRIKWRSHSGLTDGSLAQVDLTGGYYDAGDNVKFNFPMAFTTTMLSWSILEYGKRLGPELGNARAALRWGSDYLLKSATATPGRLYVGVGDPNADHKCWERPEDMDTPRTVYYVSPQNPGSDVAAETAAALAAASMVFKAADPKYSAKLLVVAKNVMEFARKYTGAYSDKLGSAVCPFYCSYSGYKDELLWGASWLLRATNDVSYLTYLKSLGANDNADIFSWDNKFAGARRNLVDNDKTYEPFRFQAETFMCSILPKSPSSTTRYTPGGLMYKLSQNNLQYVTSISFLLSTYAKYMVDYILGSNPMKMSYMVGYGMRFPIRIHHRGSSIASVASRPQHVGCQDGFQQYYYSKSPNPNFLIGAVVGGPDDKDAYIDDRTDYGRNEPATYTTAALVGPLAYLAGSYGK